MPSCPAKVHLNDIGTKLQIKILDEDKAVVILSAITSSSIILKKPDGTVSSHNATEEIDPDDGTLSLVQIVSIAGDFDAVGFYEYQAFVVFSATQQLRSEVIRLEVHEILS